MQKIKRYFPRYVELTTWVVGLVLLALMDPTREEHYSLCFFKLAGVSFCPGCGLGHSISWFFRGEVVQSFKAHPLGIFAIGVLLHRIYTLIKTRVSFLTA